MAIKDRTKRIVVCADDFGMNPAVNQGILHLAAQGVLSAASCLVQGPEFEKDAAALARSGMQLGLHLNFTESMGQPGLYLPVSRLILQAYLRRIDTEQLRLQIVRQLEVFENILGRTPDFVDGHQHVHQLPQIRDALVRELVRRYPARRPWLRYTKAGSQSGMTIPLRLKAQIIQRLGARRLAQLALQNGFALNSGFLGVYDFQGGQLAYRRLLRQWLRGAVDGDVLMCHPAAYCYTSDALGAQRLAEFEVLAGDQTAQWVQKYRLSL